MSRILDAKTFVREVAPFVTENVNDAKRRGEQSVGVRVCLYNASIAKEEAAKAVDLLLERYPLRDGYHIADYPILNPQIYEGEGGAVCLAMEVSWMNDLRSARQVYGL